MTKKQIHDINEDFDFGFTTHADKDVKEEMTKDIVITKDVLQKD